MRVSVYEEAPGFRLGPRVYQITRTHSYSLVHHELKVREQVAAQG
jgi:hypothetical protein